MAKKAKFRFCLNDIVQPTYIKSKRVISLYRVISTNDNGLITGVAALRSDGSDGEMKYHGTDVTVCGWRLIARGETEMTDTRDYLKAITE